LIIFSHIEISTGPNQHFVFSIKTCPKIDRGTVGFSLPQRKWAVLSLNQEIEVKPFYFDPTSPTEFLSNILLEVDFLQKKT
jgi:vesicle-fusing ATPase